MTRSATAQLVIPVGASDHVLGPRTALVTLVEYGDYECPACGRAYPVVKTLMRRLHMHLQFVFRNFPLASVHPHAEHAAEAAEAAGAQGKYWAMHDLLYENQSALEDARLVRYAGLLGLDESRFGDQLAAQVHAAHVREDFMGGVRSGVNGTPTFFINGFRHDGAFDFDTLRDAIDAEIANPTA